MTDPATPTHHPARVGLVGRATHDAVLAENAALRAEVERLRSVLQFYADQKNYEGEYIEDPCGCCGSWYEPVIHKDGQDSGDKARAALRERGVNG